MMEYQGQHYQEI